MSEMTLCWRCRVWKLAIASSFFIGGAIALGGGLSPIASFGDCVLAQSKIVPDGTLGTESSVVTPSVVINGIPSERIDGGAIRGKNLFHSFQEFNINEGRGAYFTNPAGIENILSRVTGASRSNILGTLGVLGNANLFLINPNGIIFGPSSSLDIGGSFVASTASSLNFADGKQFTTAHSTTPLLTVSVPIGLQLGQAAGDILVQGSSLAVQPGKTLALVGGNLALEGGSLEAEGGRIDLGSVAGSGLVSLTPIDKGWILGYGGVQNFQDIQLSQQAFVNASGEGGGDIQVQGGRVALTDESNIVADTLGSQSGGGISIRAEQLDIEDFSFVGASTSSSGKGGDITIKTGKLTAQDGAEVVATTTRLSSGLGGNLSVTASKSVEIGGAELSTATRGAGAAGDLTIQTGQLSVRDGSLVLTGTSADSSAPGGKLNVSASKSVEVEGTSKDGLFASTLSTQTQGSGAAGDLTIDTGQLTVRDGAQVSAATAGIGAAGDLTIDTGQLTVQDGAQVNAATFGSGAGGNLSVSASESVELRGTPFSSLSTQTHSTGAAGNLRIQTGRLIVRDGAQVDAATFGKGAGGNLSVNARESVEVIGTSADGQLASALATSVELEATGEAGNLTVETGRLIVRDGAQVLASTSGTGPAGNLSVNAPESVELIGRSADGRAPSGLFTQANLGDTGAGGNLTVETGRLIVRDGAHIEAGTFGTGSAGNLTVKARESVEVMGTSADEELASILSTSVGPEATGAGGNLTVETGRLIVRDGAQVLASTFGEAPAGNLSVKASESVEVIGTSAKGEVVSLLTALTNGTGDAGNLTIQTGQLTVQDGSQVSVSSTGSGEAGKLEVAARSIQLDNQGAIVATTTSGNGGDIRLRSQDLVQLRRKSQISTTAGTAGAGGDGGNIDIDAKFIIAIPSENSDITANAFTGRGGNVRITTQGIFGTQFREDETPQSDITASSRFGVNGVVEINTPDIDPSRGLVNLSETPISEGLIAQGCPADKENTFTITGRGGLPPQPGEALRTSAVLVNESRLEPKVENRSAEVTSTPVNSTSAPLVEAQGWIINAQGQVVLTAQAPTVTPDSSGSIPPTCYAP